MPTPFVAIAQALQARLLEAPQIVGDRVYRDRLRPVKAGQASAIVVRLINSTGAPAGAGRLSPHDWTTEYGIECYARADGDEPTDAVDPIVEAAFARLSGIGASLNLSVEDVLPDPQITWDIDDAQDQLCCATFVVRVIHRTQSGALVAWNT